MIALVLTDVARADKRPNCVYKTVVMDQHFAFERCSQMGVVLRKMV